LKLDDVPAAPKMQLHARAGPLEPAIRAADIVLKDNTTILSDTESSSSDSLLRQQFLTAFYRAGIYVWCRRRLADQLLAEDGPRWLRVTLGWICYAVREAGYGPKGGLIYAHLRDGLLCDPEYLPPPEMAFEAALEWALRGGLDEPEPWPASDGPAGNDTDDDAASGPPGAQLDGAGEAGGQAAAPEHALWQAALAQLKAQLPPNARRQLRGTRLLPSEDGAWTVWVPAAHSRDWLANRLTAATERVLRGLAGRPGQVTWRCDERSAGGP
jgi:hypothetical protein